jgi:SAM-dependent methyltransferase
MSEISEQRVFYDERWAGFKYPGHLELDRASKVVELMRHVKNYERICDLGCGAGWIAGVLGHFGRTLGVDLSNVDRARARFTNCEFVSADILNWDYPRESFTLVVSSEVIEHIPYPRQPDYLRVCHDLLEPGGSLILTTPNKKTMNAIPGGGRTWSNQPIEDWLELDQLVRLLQSAGFRPTHLTSTTLGIGNLGLHRIVNSIKLNRSLERAGLRDAWHRLVLGLGFGLHLAVHCEKPRTTDRA